MIVQKHGATRPSPARNNVTTPPAVTIQVNASKRPFQNILISIFGTVTFGNVAAVVGHKLFDNSSRQSPADGRKSSFALASAESS